MAYSPVASLDGTIAEDGRPSASRRIITQERRTRRWESGLRHERTTRGKGSAPLSKQTLPTLKTYMLKRECGALIEYALALKAAAKAKRSELKMGDGCASRACSARHEPGKFQRR
eukprot:6879922-Prymnesium_polylepis.1